MEKLLALPNKHVFNVYFVLSKNIPVYQNQINQNIICQNFSFKCELRKISSYRPLEKITFYSMNERT